MSGSIYTAQVVTSVRITSSRPTQCTTTWSGVLIIRVKVKWDYINRGVHRIRVRAVLQVIELRSG